MHWMCKERVCNSLILIDSDKNFWKPLGFCFIDIPSGISSNIDCWKTPRFSLMIFPFLIDSRCSMAIFDFSRGKPETATRTFEHIPMSLLGSFGRQSLCWLRRRFDVRSMWQVSPIDRFFQVDWLKKWDHMRTDKIRWDQVGMKMIIIILYHIHIIYIIYTLYIHDISDATAVRSAEPWRFLALQSPSWSGRKRTTSGRVPSHCQKEEMIPEMVMT